MRTVFVLRLPVLLLRLVSVVWPMALAACAVERAPSQEPLRAPPSVRVATFNVWMYRDQPGGLIEDLSGPRQAQIAAVTEIIQRVRPDILLLNEFDYDTQGEGGRSLALELFHQRYLQQGQGAAAPIDYPYRLSLPSNTGLHSARFVPGGFDLDGNGEIDPRPGSRIYGGDALGYGTFEGQYALAVLSRYPIQLDGVRTFQKFLWRDMPGARLPVQPQSGAPFYSQAVQAVLRLSSKTHADVPVQIGERVLHLLASHPTPPVFDGDEDRNGLRNADEIRFWADYVRAADYMVDDQGRSGGLDSAAHFVIAGDLNADPNDGDSLPGAIQQLLEHPLVQAAPVPASQGGVDRARAQGGVNNTHLGNPAFDTADFGERSANVRLDYVLPSATLAVLDAGVFWPADSAPTSQLTGPGSPPVSSDHRLVWIDVVLDAAAAKE